ncbi:MAG: hypothetical protein DRJ56_00805 [Thermoprotei archaeon]|mgnify:CR=1 FL=1|nr:MAG: hypothetical protein DRJ56_00805 [Thermoprotei archaeon]
MNRWLVLFVVAPAALLAVAVIVTDYFSAHPRVAQGPVVAMIASATAAAVAVIGYKAMVEEGWEGGLAYRLGQGLCLGYLIVSALFLALMVMAYLLKGD